MRECPNERQQLATKDLTRLLTHRDVAASKVEPHVKPAQEIEAEQSIHAACWGQCVAQSLKPAYPFPKRLNIFKGQLRTILNSAPRGDRSPLLNRCRIVAYKNRRFPTHQCPGSSGIQSEIYYRVASRAIQLCLNEYQPRFRVESITHRTATRSSGSLPT